MDLKTYRGKFVEVEYFDGEKIKGYALGYTPEADDEMGENLTLETEKYEYYCVYANEIKNITVLDEKKIK